MKNQKSKKSVSKALQPVETQKKKYEDYTAEELDAMPFKEHCRLQAEMICENLNAVVMYEENKNKSS